MQEDKEVVWSVANLTRCKTNACFRGHRGVRVPKLALAPRGFLAPMTPNRGAYCRIAIDAASSTAARVAPMLATPLPAMS